MSGDYLIAAKYTGIQDYHDTMASISNKMSDSQDGCRQVFHTLEPLCVGSLGTTAQTMHAQAMQKFDEHHTDWHALQLQSQDQVQGLAAVDQACGAALT